MTDHDVVPLILFSGLAADATIFAPQKLVFSQLIVPDWPTPQPNETLDSYSQRLANDLRRYGPCFLGGASFGGIVALHVAQYLPSRGVILIGSVRQPDELPRFARFARCLTALIRFLPVRLAQLLSIPFTSKCFRHRFPHLSDFARQFRRADPTIFKWSLSQILEWKKPPTVSCPIFHIHGSRDRALPARLTRPNLRIEGGGHVISITHSKQVNMFIETILCGKAEKR